ncbi:M14 family metallopeptidase [Bacteroidales bacterium OttesenSCG-928-L14]|nr:M14 family metallopeptidase [Bacteroidales bacterium OttesenSCG-928-L14]
MNKAISILIVAIVFFSCTNKSNNTDLLTVFEKTNYLQTANYEETIKLSKSFASSFKEINYVEIGKTLQNREIPLLILDKDGLTNPEIIKNKGRLVVMINACIHPGEPNGKDAGLMLLRDLANRKFENANELLDNISIIFIPICSPDGLANFSPYNRINQNGPKEMGWRVNSQGLNLNRDFIKVESPEIEAFIKTFNKWEPDFFFDTHSSNGADYQYVLTYMIEDNSNYDKNISSWLSNIWEPQINEKMFDMHYPICRYVTFRNWGDPTSGLHLYPSTPMFSQAYAASRNCPGVLIECHMLKPYKERVYSTYNFILETMNIVIENKSSLQQSITNAKNNDLQMKQLPINFNPSQNDSLMIDFLGYEFQSVKSELTGGNYYVYDKSKPAVLSFPMFNNCSPEKTINIPEKYIIPVEYTNIIRLLELHNFEIEYLKEDLELEIKTYKFDNVRFRSTPNEGHQMLSNFTTNEISRKVKYHAGSAIVRTSQNGVRLLISMLELEVNSSLLRWGYFNTIFQRVEYFEVYKMEPMAAKMLQSDQELVKEYEQYLKENDGKLSQRQILDWFYERTPYYDDNYLVYPIGRM